MKIVKKLLLLVAMLGLSVQANAVILDFESGTAGTDVGSAYSGLGITFQNTSFVSTAGVAGKDGLLGIAGRGGPWDYAFGESHAIVASFDFGVSSVSIMGFDVGAGGARIEAYDMYGTLLTFDEAFGTGIGIGENFTLTAGASAIYSIKLFQVTEGLGSDGMFFDLLSFEAASVPETTSLVLLGLGLLGMGFARRKA